MRRDGPPTSLAAEFTATRAGRHQLIWRRGGKPIACRKIAGRRASRRRRRRGRRERLAVGARLGSALREPLLGLDRDAVRRARRSVAGLPAAAPGAARSGAQLPLRLPRPARGRSEEQGRDRGHARLRRPAVLPARLLLLEARAAVRVPRLRPRHRIAAAALHDLLQQRRRADGQGHAGGGEELLPADRRTACSRAARARRSTTTRPTTTRCRSSARRCARASSTPIRTAT